MTKNNKIHEIELNFSNVCTAECIICSRPHGVGNSPFMEPEVFDTLVSQLKDVDFKQIQTSGNGEAFLNPHYLDYIRTLKKEFPKAPRWTYNNFSLITQARAGVIVEERLFDKIHVRIDSMVDWVFKANSNLNREVVFKNLEYFLEINKDIPVTLLYNNINDYYDRCQKLLGRRPVRDFFTDEQLAQIPDEQDAILKHFQEHSDIKIDICRIGHSLWGERTTAPIDTKTPCPKWNVITNVTWVCPDGSVCACCYDDAQDSHVVGNIMEEHILDIFHGPKRAEILKGIENRTYTGYPCTNPKCCGFGDIVEEKKI